MSPEPSRLLWSLPGKPHLAFMSSSEVSVNVVRQRLRRGGAALYHCGLSFVDWQSLSPALIYHVRMADSKAMATPACNQQPPAAPLSTTPTAQCMGIFLHVLIFTKPSRDDKHVTAAASHLFRQFFACDEPQRPKSRTPNRNLQIGHGNAKSNMLPRCCRSKPEAPAGRAGREASSSSTAQGEKLCNPLRQALRLLGAR